MEVKSGCHGNQAIILNQFKVKFILQSLTVLILIVHLVRSDHHDATIARNADDNSIETLGSNHSDGYTTDIANSTEYTFSTSISTTPSSRTLHNTYETPTVVKTTTAENTNLPEVTTLQTTTSIEITTVRGTCGGAYYTKNGNFYSPEFPKNYLPGHYCEYSIHANGGYFISLNFSLFDLRGYSCQYDYIVVRDGIGSTGKLVGVYCGGIGRKPPSLISSWTNNMYLLFVSSEIFTDLSYQGFKANYFITPTRPADPTDPPTTGQCGGYIEGRLEGNIGTPYYPDADYPSDIKCIYVISVPKGYNVMLTFTSFELQSGKCIFDFVDVIDGYDNGKLTGTYCGSFAYGTGQPPPTKLMSSTNSLTLVFQSDEEYQYPGFSANFEATEQEVMNMSICTVCDETRKVFTDRGGILVSHGNYSHEAYPNRQKTCLTKLLGTADSEIDNIYITFLETDLYPPTDRNRCQALSDDNIQLLDELGTPKTTLCGSNTGSFTSNRPLMEVKFTTFSREDRQTVITSEGSSTSQDQFDYKGFKAVYTIFYKVESGSGECNIGDFKCDNGWCIAQWLTCDGYKNCEDGSDEYGCTTVQNHSSFLGVIVGLTVAIIFGIVSYVLLITVSKKRGYKCLGIRRPGERARANSRNRSREETWDRDIQMQTLPSLYPQYGPPPAYDEISFDMVYAFDNLTPGLNNDLVAPSSPPSYTEESQNHQSLDVDGNVSTSQGPQFSERRYSRDSHHHGEAERGSQGHSLAASHAGHRSAGHGVVRREQELDRAPIQRPQPPSPAYDLAQHRSSDSGEIAQAVHCTHRESEERGAHRCSNTSRGVENQAFELSEGDATNITESET
ncbi:uncharacterized protein [Ptychodera flava]|uniref:uncharacterized protein n=1 Tax=Ptychodera flava TaxID=63121 RepID=UPI00396A990C